MTVEEKKPRQMPKGGRTGGAQFPRSTLQDAFKQAKKLVTKTHVSPMARDAVYAGVVGAKSGIGNMKISALKQYGYLAGTADAYTATTHAKNCVAAPPDEIISLHQQSALRPTIFKALFDTFNGDEVSRAKLRQRAAELKVHPDQTEACIEIYLSTMSTANLVHVDGDKVTHLSLGENGSRKTESPGEEGDRDLPANNRRLAEDDSTSQSLNDGGEVTGTNVQKTASNLAPRAVFNVNVTLDSSLDTEKLQKQLELLKRYGAL